MAAASLLALIDDIATVLDDVSVLTKVAAKKTAGVLGDDLALNAQQVYDAVVAAGGPGAAKRSTPDRVTVYRTLGTLVEAGLAHRFYAFTETVARDRVLAAAPARAARATARRRRSPG